MQRFPESDAKYAYSPEHASIGTVQPGELFEVESVEGYSGYFRSPSDFTAERYARGGGGQVGGRPGPITVAGAEAGGAVAVTIHAVEVTTPGVVVYGAYTATDPYEWWDDESACDAYPAEDGVVRFDERTTLPTRPLIGCLAVAPGRGRGAREAPGPLRRQPRLPRAPRRRDDGPARRHDGGGLYFGDCKALMGDGEIVGPPEVGALVTASAEPRERPASMNGRGSRQPRSLMTLVSGKPLEWSARQAYRELLEWVVDDYEIARPQAALLLAMVAQARHLPDQQHRLHGLLRRAARELRPYRELTHEAARVDGDHAVDDAVAHGQQAVVEVDAAAGVVRHHAAGDRRAGPLVQRRDVDVAVLLVDRVQIGSGKPDDRAVPAVRVRVGGERLRARVDHDLPGTESETTVTSTASAHLPSAPSTRSSSA